MNLSKIRDMVLQGDMSVQALRYLLECRGECEWLDHKITLHLNNDHSYASLGRDAVAMRNSGGGYIILGVQDQTWQPVGLDTSISADAKQLRDIIRKSTGLEIDADIVSHNIFILGKRREFSIILIRSTAKLHKLRVPSICKNSFHPKENWGIRNGDIYFRKGDSTVRVSSDHELEELLEDLRDRIERSQLEIETQEPSPFEIENGMYRLLPLEYDFFVGRANLREYAKKAIEQDPRIWIINLYGPGGVGKSAIASWLTRYYYERKDFDCILQLSAKDKQLTERGISTLTPSLYSLENLINNILILFGFSEFLDTPLEERKDIVHKLLSDYSSLLVLDNMETVQDGRIMEFVRSLPPSTKTKVLLTSRLRTSGWEIPVRVDELSFEEVREFCKIKAEEMGLSPLPDFEESVEQLYAASGGLPLAIQWMLGEYAISGDWKVVTNRIRSSDSPLLEFSFRNSWDRLTHDAQKALAVLSIFNKPPTTHLWATALNCTLELVEQATSLLIESTFVSEKIDSKTGQKTYHALPITLEFARNELGKMGDLEIHARTNYQRHIQQMELVAVETEQYKSLFEKFNVERDTEKRAIILARKAESEKVAFNYDDAEQYYQKALDIDPRSIYVLVNYGLLKRELRQIGKAIELIEQAAKRCNKNTGFYVYYNLSQVYDDERNRSKMEASLRKALEYNPHHPVARHQLGVVISRQGRYEEAIQIFDSLIADELNREYGPSTTLLFTYKTKIVSLDKWGHKSEVLSLIQTAEKELQQWPHLAERIPELYDVVDLYKYRDVTS